MHYHSPLSDISISPALVGAALDCIAHLADLNPLRPAHLRMIGGALQCGELEADVLALRVLAFADVLNDNRWPPWSVLYRQMTPAQRRAFDAKMLQIVAVLPLDGRGRFHADSFYDGLLDATAGDRGDVSVLRPMFQMPRQ
jgi:hypothetical protein